MSEKLAGILQKNKQTILEDWEKTVRHKLSAARKESKTALRDSVPDFLEDLIIALRTSLSNVKPEIIKFAHKHGSERANASDYSIEDALSEYNILRKIIFTHLENESEILPEERDIILEAINFGMMKAGDEYAKRQVLNLQEERNVLETIIEQMPAAVWIAKAPSGEILASNSLGKKDLYYKAFHQSSHILARSILNGSTCKNEIVKIKKADKTDDYIRLDASAVVNSSGEITYGVAIGTDVTELYAAQEELRVLFEKAATGKAVMNPDTGKIIRVNDAFCRMMKYTCNELLSLSLSDITTDNKAGNQQEFRCKDSEVFWGEYYYSNIPGTPENPRQAVFTIIDITKRKLFVDQMNQFNMRLQRIADIQPNLIGQVDKNLRYEFVNKTYESWYGIEIEEMIGKKISEVLGDEEFAKVEPYLNRALQGEKVVFEKFIKFKHATPRHIHCTYSPNINEDGEVVGLFISVSDTTEQKQILEEQREVTDALYAEQKMRDKFISALSHDLRTPLTTATISAQMIERKADNPKLQGLAQRATSSLNRVAKMIEDLLDANSFQAGNKFIPELEFMNVVELTQNTLNELETIYGARFILDSTDEINTFLSANGIRRVLENLCSNAIKYGSQTAPVTVGLSKVGQYLSLTVHNFGVPLKAEETQAIFEEFVRSSSAEKSGKIGWGIGLSIVKGVVEAQGGTVDIQSDEDGTLFKIRLPLDARAYVNGSEEEISPTAH